MLNDMEIYIEENEWQYRWQSGSACMQHRSAQWQQYKAKDYNNVVSGPDTQNPVSVKPQQLYMIAAFFFIQ